MSNAEMIAARYNNNGATFRDADGIAIATACRHCGASEIRADEGGYFYAFLDDSYLWIGDSGWDLVSPSDDGDGFVSSGDQSVVYR